MSTFGRPQWVSPSSIEGAMPAVSCAGRLLLDGTRRRGGCARVHERWILTAHHVVDIPDIARRFQVRFNDFKGGAGPAYEYRLDPDGGYFASADGVLGASGRDFDLDYAFIALAGPYPEEDPSRQHAATLHGDPVAGGEAARIPQAHGVPPSLALPVERAAGTHAGRVAALEGAHFFYATSTRPGTSGAPVIDEHGRLLGIHTTGRRAREAHPLRRDYNSGTLLAAILADARSRHPGLPPELA